jgi:hypothetical protein
VECLKQLLDIITDTVEEAAMVTMHPRGEKPFAPSMDAPKKKYPAVGTVAWEKLTKSKQEELLTKRGHKAKPTTVEDYSGIDTTSFLSFIMEAEKMSKKLPQFKPRTKDLNDALLSKRGGPMPDKKDINHSRTKQKQELNKELKETDLPL